VARRTGDDLHVAILGLGEAGGRLAADLVALGVKVAGWDPLTVPGIEGMRRADDAADAVDGCDVVLSVNSSRAAVAAACDCAGALPGVGLYADLNTAAPATKVAVAAVVGGSGALFADVALLAPVPRHGIGTPALASGPGADAFARRFRPLGMPVEVLGPEAGVAAQRKLLRSVFMKGLAAAIVESLEGAEAVGCEDWLRGEITATLESADAMLVDRLVDGSRRHAGRRMDEMDAACELLRELGVEPRIAAGAAAQLAELVRSADEVRTR
jgi:3-hydroxyisobutyrate dehydrogenase-like beta-hydroxyacid dehydrogenase